MSRFSLYWVMGGGLRLEKKQKSHMSDFFTHNLGVMGWLLSL